MKFRPELLLAIEQLEVTKLRRLSALLSGHYRSPYQGSGMQFKEFRPYSFGDDVRHMSWQVTARTGSPTLKVYEEDRELNILLLVDSSGSSLFGFNQTKKIDMYLELVALFGMASVKASDNVGMLLFNEQPLHYLPPRRSREHVLLALKKLTAEPLQGKKSDLRPALDFLASKLKGPTLVFVFSDFLVPNFEREAKRLSQKHEICFFHCYDDAEKGSLEKGIFEVCDPETGEFYLLDGSSAQLRRELNQFFFNTKNNLEILARNTGSDYLSLSVQDDYLQRVVRHFKSRGTSHR